MTDVAEKDSCNSLEETGSVACEPTDRSILQVENSMIDDFIFVWIESLEPLIISNNTNERCPNDNCHVEQNRSNSNIGKFLDRLYFSFHYEDHAHANDPNVDQNSHQFSFKISK